MLNSNTADAGNASDAAPDGATPPTNSPDLAALLARSPRFAKEMAKAEALSGDERNDAMKDIALGFFAKSVKAYIEIGGPSAGELAAHLKKPANDTAAKPAVATKEAPQRPPEPKPIAAKKQAKKWNPPKIPMLAFKDADDADLAISKYVKSAGNVKKLAAAIGASLDAKTIDETDAATLLQKLHEKSGVAKATLKTSVGHGRRTMTDEAKAEEAEQARNAPRGLGFDFLQGTDYVVSNDGKRFGVNEKRGENSAFSPICGAFHVLGKVKDENRGSWGLRISYRDHDDGEHQVTVNSADWNGDPRALRSALADRGFNVVPYAKYSLERLFADILPKFENTLTIYSRPGWHDSTFLTALGEAIGDDADSAILSDRTGAEDRETKGTLEGWKSAANELAELNDHWAIGLAAGFAGILIDRCGLDTAAACISGPTSDGKTIALTLSASVHGNPKERAGVLHPLRVTSNSIERLFERASGATISLDELALAEARDVGAMLMLLASGSGKARMTKASALQHTASWRCFVLFSSERSLRNIVEGAKGQYLGGHAVRCVDIATTGARRHDPSAVRALGQKLKENYGHAAPIFAAYLLAMGEAGEPGKLRERIAAAAKTFAGEQASPAQARAAHTFAVLAVAASIAEDAGLIDDGANAIDALERAWARYAAGDELRAADPVAEALERLADYVTTNRNHTILPLPKKGEDDSWRGGDEGEERQQNRTAWGYYDDGVIYVAKERLISMAGGAVKYDDLRRGLGDNLLRRGAKDLVWQELPGSGRKLSHYRIKAAFFLASDKESEKPAA